MFMSLIYIIQPKTYLPLLSEIYHLVLIIAFAMLWKNFGCNCMLNVSIISIDFIIHLHHVGFYLHIFLKIWAFSSLINNLKKGKEGTH